MVSSTSGRSSVEQDDELVRQFRGTPRTPTKMSFVGKNGVSSAQRRRGLFQPSSPASSESSNSLGHMSPLSSSLESLQSIGSPSFSPNGECHYDTPLKTPRDVGMRASLSTLQIGVRSTLFPALRKSPKLRRSPRSSQTVRASPTVRESMALLQDILGDTESSSNQTTPRSSRRRQYVVAETVTSPSSVGTPPSQRKPIATPNSKSKQTKKIIPASPVMTSPGLKPVPETDFYGPPAPKPGTMDSQKPGSVAPDHFYAPTTPRPALVIDSLAVRGRRIRRDSESSKRNFVSGGSKRRRSNSRSTSRSGKRQKGLIPGVWHGIKKPKKMNKSAPEPKPAMSPNTRAVQVIRTHRTSGKRLFEQKPRRRVAGAKDDKDAIIDPFPPSRIKRKKLPSTPEKEPEPDPSKKFLKLGAYRKATFTLNNVHVEFKNGKGRVKTPEKRRPLRAKKLYSPPALDPVDFSLQEPETSDIQRNVEDILQQLTEGDAPTPPNNATFVQVEKMSDEQLMTILDSPSTKVKLVDASPGKMVTELHSSPQRTLLANMSSLALNDRHTPDFGRLPLGATGGLLSAASNILNADQDGGFDANCDADENCENQGQTSRVFPVFDPTTWKAKTVLTDLSNVPKQWRRKNPLVADDQYLLDAGQKSIGIVSCKECGVMYQAGDYLDEVAHNNVHNHLSELIFQGWKEERVVAKFQDGRVVMVTATDPKPWQDKAKKVVGVVDLELGFSENTLKWTPDKKVLLFVCEKLKQVVGCLVSEACSEGYRMYPSIEGVEVDTCARDPTPCKVGISRIWTAVHRRRRGVATRLFGAICRLAGDVEADDVAFSIPSPDGKQLARALVAREDFKVYGFLSV